MGRRRRGRWRGGGDGVLGVLEVFVVGVLSGGDDRGGGRGAAAAAATGREQQQQYQYQYQYQ